MKGLWKTTPCIFWTRHSKDYGFFFDSSNALGSRTSTGKTSYS